MLSNAPETENLHESLCELAQTVGDAVKVDVGPIRDELALVRSLMLDASQQLQLSFSSIDQQARAQLLQVGELHEKVRLGNSVPHGAPIDSTTSDALRGSNVEEFQRISARVTESINQAVRALQFEDLATQLIDCVQRRIVRLEAVAIRLEDIVVHFEHAPRVPGLGVSASVAELRTQLASLRGEYATILVSPVAPRGLDAGGTIDLF